MCGLCGVLGVGDHWSDTLGTPEQTNDFRIKRRRESTKRAELANQILAFYGVKLSSWQNSNYVLATMTGRHVVFDHLAALWPQVETLSGKICDPLDDALIDAMTSRTGNTSGYG